MLQDQVGDVSAPVIRGVRSMSLSLSLSLSRNERSMSSSQNSVSVESAPFLLVSSPGP
jgi:hypothetical protein